ncbi:arsenate reductase/protein-tyrosine-phosphatase family protein [Modestobacter sp. VKM Ac-2978]|uniref:arsenate reductase/protein-tyrosine-phosphatase family protein n=1 Tax=Modestobacter sp. VKM Ac-2978 TaxID=3004132 RepID=UPI0022AAE116|nr:hypothetical protein [Modestobacter sp. VKM Ac-2978]MCZ2846986.1 hypothetical protein [Modestobacter sp. VKM Ac-2978]
MTGEAPVAPPAGAPTCTVLLVCTGNICRSPLAERLARAHLAQLLGAEAGGIHVVSAGTRALAGSGMDPASARALQQLGGDPSGFRARQLTGRIAASADLTLTMTRAHRQEVLARAPRAMARTFTLREAADLLELVGPEPGSGAGTPAERGRGLVRQLAAARSRRSGGATDDVLDPIGQPPEVHAAVGRAVADALLPILDRLALAAFPGGTEP